MITPLNSKRSKIKRKTVTWVPYRAKCCLKPVHGQGLLTTSQTDLDRQAEGMASWPKHQIRNTMIPWDWTQNPGRRHSLSSSEMYKLNKARPILGQTVGWNSVFVFLFFKLLTVLHRHQNFNYRGPRTCPSVHDISSFLTCPPLPPCTRKTVICLQSQPVEPCTSGVFPWKARILLNKRRITNVHLWKSWREYIHSVRSAKCFSFHLVIAAQGPMYKNKGWMDYIV